MSADAICARQIPASRIDAGVGTGQNGNKYEISPIFPVEFPPPPDNSAVILIAPVRFGRHLVGYRLRGEHQVHIYPLGCHLLVHARGPDQQPFPRSLPPQISSILWARDVPEINSPLRRQVRVAAVNAVVVNPGKSAVRNLSSEEHTSELQPRL